VVLKAIIEKNTRVPLTPLEEARAYQANLDDGVTIEELARRLGVKQSLSISGRLALLNSDGTKHNNSRRELGA